MNLKSQGFQDQNEFVIRKNKIGVDLSKKEFNRIINLVNISTLIIFILPILFIKYISSIFCHSTIIIECGSKIINKYWTMFILKNFFRKIKSF